MKKQKPAMATFGFDSPPLDTNQLDTLRSSLRETYIGYLTGVITLIVVAAIITLKVMSLGYEQYKELLHLSIYIGCGIGFFSSVTIRATMLMRIQFTVIGIAVCTAAGLSCSMFLMLVLGYAPNWISSINILASALASMWLLTYYDANVKAISSIKYVNSNQLAYIIKVANHFDSLMSYAKSIHQKDREPVMGEYWVILDWINDRKLSN